MMRRILLLFVILCGLLPVLNARVVRPIRLRPSSEQLEPSKPVKMHSDNTLIIHYNGKSGKRSLLKAVKRYGAKVIYDYKNFSSIAVKLPEGKNVDDAKAYFEKVKGVKQVNYDRIMQLM